MVSIGEFSYIMSKESSKSVEPVLEPPCFFFVHLIGVDFVASFLTLQNISGRDFSEQSFRGLAIRADAPLFLTTNEPTIVLNVVLLV